MRDNLGAATLFVPGDATWGGDLLLQASMVTWRAIAIDLVLVAA